MDVALEQAKQDPSKTAWQVLIDAGKLTEEDLNFVRGHSLGILVVDLQGEKIDPNVLSIIPEPIARKHNIVAYRKSENGLEVAMLEPDDLIAVEFIKKKAGLKILPRLTNKESIRYALLQYQKSLKAEFGDIISREAAGLKEPDESSIDKEGELRKMAEDLPIVRIVDTLLNHAIFQKASDIHIEPFERDVLVRYRIDGILHDAMVLPKKTAPGITARIKVLSQLRLDEKRLPQDGRFKIETGGITGIKVSFRVSILPTYFGEKIVMRLLPEDSKGFTLESLGFHGTGLEALHKAMRQTVGMILVTGPTGSGKSTTLYTVLDILNRPEVNISTVEDPVEYQMQRINQTQVKPEIGLTFASGLRSLLRQDPDIIMVGEIRDKETANLSINAALTGHLVVTTLHTNSAAGAIPRFIDMGGEPFLLVSTINIVIAQRLVRRLCNNGEKYFLSKAEIKALEVKANLDRVLGILKEEKVVRPDDTFETIPFYKPRASDICPSGYSSRVAIHEILNVTQPIKELIIKKASSDEIEAEARKEGMMTLIEDGVFQAASGLTTLEEVLRVANE
ncbi:MAG: type II/IV secretion system protein [Candidatus Vogelbacteria bacterium]|nr:type II/IV secretion system protein [Candidatus Vogelbacteria bacterium]